MKRNELTVVMVEHMNLKLKEDGSCLRYVESQIDGNTVSYDLMAVDKYISTEYRTSVSVTKEFETIVREFFKRYDVEHIGFSNTVATIFAEKE